MNNNNIPTYNVSLENLEMLAIALVDDPAIDRSFQHFSKEDSPRWSFSSEAEHMILGPLIRVDYPIIRISGGTPYYMVFSREVAQQMLSQFLSDGNQNQVNLMHLPTVFHGVEPVQFFIKDSPKGISPKGYEDIADGSVFAQYHVSDEALWREICSGTFKGFSLECYCQLKPEAFSRKDLLHSLYEVLHESTHTSVI